MGVVILLAYIVGGLVAWAIVTAVLIRWWDEGEDAEMWMASALMGLAFAMVWPLVVIGVFVVGMARHLLTTADKVDAFVNPPKDPERERARAAAMRDLDDIERGAA